MNIPVAEAYYANSDLEAVFAEGTLIGWMCNHRIVANECINCALALDGDEND